MAYSRRLRAGMTIVVLVMLVVFVAGPALYGIILWDFLFRVRGLAHRRRIARWQYLCGEAALAVVSLVMGITVTYDLPPPVPGAGPYIVVANHLGGFDGFIVTHVLRAIGASTDLRAIGKREVRRYPVVGRAWRELKWGFVARRHDPHDFDAVEQCGRDADGDGANVVIFPEGTIYMRTNRREWYVNVLPPKSGGLAALRRVLPSRQVLNITIAWDRETHGLTMMEGGVPLGRRVTVTARVVDVPEDVKGWLREEWVRKDAVIAAG